jgi:hypothetical protein
MKILTFLQKKRKYNIFDVIFTSESMKELLDVLATFIAQEFNSLTTLYTLAELRMVCCKLKQISTEYLLREVER